MPKVQTNGSGSVYTVNGSILLTNDSGEGGSGTRDVTLTRISDDNNNEIGTWYMNFEDGSGNIFKVVLLDAQYRNDSTQWCSDDSASVTNMPIYNSSYNLWWYDDAKETATYNTQLILDFCTANNYTSSACTHCRSQSFTINGTTYYGQLPNAREVFDLWRHRTNIELMDTTASSYSGTNFSEARDIWTSNQGEYFFNNSAYGLFSSGDINSNFITSNHLTCPVLEIPA